jgi:hypothetical protein
MNAALRALGLLAGIVAFDILLNIPGVSGVSPVLSLLAPSIDLLVVLAILMSASYATRRVRIGFAVAVALLVALFAGWEAFGRWGQRAGAALVVILAAAALVAGGASFFLSRLVLRGFSDATLRSVFLLTAAGCAMMQALLGVRIFSPSVVPVLLGFR